MPHKASTMARALRSESSGTGRTGFARLTPQIERLRALVRSPSRGLTSDEQHELAKLLATLRDLLGEDLDD